MTNNVLMVSGPVKGSDSFGSGPEVQLCWPGPEFNPLRVKVLKFWPPMGDHPGRIELVTDPELAGTLRPFGSVALLGKDASGDCLYHLTVSRLHSFHMVLSVLNGGNVTMSVDMQMLQHGRLMMLPRMPTLPHQGDRHDLETIVFGLLLGLVVFGMLLVALVG